MNREYHRWYSAELGRDMEMLVFGHSGLPAVVFPTSQARFYEFEDQGMVAAVADKLDRGQLQLFCVDSVDSESWYNRGVGSRWRIARQVQYDLYIVREVMPYLRWRNGSPYTITLGCSLGGFHAANTAFRHPDLFSGCLSMSGAFDLVGLGFLDGYADEDVYLNQPLQYLPNLTDPWFLDRMRKGRYVLATGEHDQCWDDNERLAGVLRARGLPVQLDVWKDSARHDWPCWKAMAQIYL